MPAIVGEYKANVKGKPRAPDSTIGVLFDAFKLLNAKFAKESAKDAKRAAALERFGGGG
jgi:hypothetical protein